jgi:pullulanase
MKLNNILLSLFFPFSFILGSHAQSFNEMTYSPSATSFHLFAPSNSKSVKLRIYNNGVDGKPFRTVEMKSVGHDMWQAVLKGDMKGKFYTFDVSGDNNHWRETAGVFAKAVGVNGKRGAIIDMRETNPSGWENDVRPVVKSPADLVIYELHHRDFSIDASSGLVHKGKFLALTEPKAIDYLTSLGVNAIHILPSFDYASVDETHLERPQYNWGYDPMNYNVPEGSYSENPFNPATRIKEFKEMVQALHKAGIRVILDVVYNHTFNIDGSGFQRTFPDYFYRKKSDGKWSDGTGCGNETASEKPMMRKFMIESVKYWIKEYHVDGFRFDLMGVHDIETMNQIRKAVDSIDPSIFIYGEGWSAGSCAYPQDKLATKANIQQLHGIAAFSDDMRDALRGPFNDDHKGAFLAAIPGSEESLKFGIVGAIKHPQIDYTKINYSKKEWADEPTQQISYVSCHDDMCLTDRLRASIACISTAELIRLDLLAQTAVLTSQGVPFILSGEEMLRDKKGVHNSYASPDAINHLDWTNLKRYPQVFDYYKNLIALRKHHQAFRLGSAKAVCESLEFISSQPGLVAFRLKNNAGGDKWNDIVVILNANKAMKTVDIPEGAYTVVCKDGTVNESGICEIKGNKASVGPQSALIIHN